MVEYFLSDNKHFLQEKKQGKPESEQEFFFLKYTFVRIKQIGYKTWISEP